MTRGEHDAAFDARWLPGLRDGQAAAFDATYAAYAPRVYAFLVRLSHRRALADDLAQETWLRLARHAPRLVPDTRLLPWLFTVARNLYRSHQRWLLVDGDALTIVRDAAALEPASPESLAAAGQLEARVEAALAALPVAARELLLLCAVEELPPTQVAEILGLRPEAVRQRLLRARRQLAALLAEPATIPTTLEPA